MNIIDGVKYREEVLVGSLTERVCVEEPTFK
jgi:hypothetical protein